MNNRSDKILRKIFTVLAVSAMVAVIVLFNEFFIYILSQTALFAAKTYLPSEGITLPCFVSTTAEAVTEITTTQEPTKKEEVQDVAVKLRFTDTPDDIKQVIVEREKTASKDKKDGDIYEKHYKNEGVTDSFGAVKVYSEIKISREIENITGCPRKSVKYIHHIFHRKVIHKFCYAGICTHSRCFISICNSVYIIGRK